MKRKNFFIDEYPVVIKSSNEGAFKPFFWALLMLTLGSFVFYVWMFTKEYPFIFYSMIGIAWASVVVQRRFKKDMEKKDEDSISAYSDAMIMITIASVIFGLMAILILANFRSNYWLWWIIAGLISLCFPSYPNSEYKKDVGRLI